MPLAPGVSTSVVRARAQSGESEGANTLPQHRRRDNLSGQAFHITGRVIDRQTRLGLVKLRVKAWEEDSSVVFTRQLFVDKAPLGQLALTDQAGCCGSTYPDSAFRSAAMPFFSEMDRPRLAIPLIGLFVRPCHEGRSLCDTDLIHRKTYSKSWSSPSRSLQLGRCFRACSLPSEPASFWH